jgi:hypothetical protein
MANLDFNRTTTTALNSAIQDFTITNQILDESGGDEYSYVNPDWTQYLGYYKQIPELKQAVDSLAVWTAGKGYITDSRTKVILEHIQGWGEDTFDSILMALIVVKKINGDAFAEIIRDPDTDTIINLKPLNPSNMRIIVNRKGIIIRYEEIDAKSKKTIRKYKKNEIFHLCNSRIANEIHGTSVIEACKWVIDAKQEAMADWRRILHRSTIRVLEVDTEDTTKLLQIRNQYAEAIKNGEVLVLPKNNSTFADYTAPPAQVFLEWIRYLDNFFYQALGIPKIIVGGAQEYTEASSKVGYLTFEQVYAVEQRLLEQDIWNQLYLRVEFERPVSLKEDMINSEAANTGQVGFQPNEVTAQVGRVE